MKIKWVPTRPPANMRRAIVDQNVPESHRLQRFVMYHTTGVSIACLGAALAVGIAIGAVL